MWMLTLISSMTLLALAEGVCHNYEKDYYAELGCTPEAEDEAEAGCPTSYDCSSLSQRGQDKCHYQGKAYDDGHSLETTPATACLAVCRCGSNYHTKKMAFTCVSVECPELFIGPPPPGCYRTYEHGRCCHVDEICTGGTAEQKTPKAVCVYKGETLQEGQKFYPDEEPCLQCICQSGYNGSFVEPYCQKIHCNLELMDGHRISEGCVPIYYGEKGCCPIDWRCPQESDSVITSEAKGDSKSSADSVPGKTCKFGKLMMQVGEKLSQDSDRGEMMECTCRVPPHPVCIQKESS